MCAAHESEGKEEGNGPKNKDGDNSEHDSIQNQATTNSENAAVEEHAAQFDKCQGQNLHQFCGPKHLKRICQGRRLRCV